MRKCTFCNLDKPLEDFSNQKTNPRKLYAWCDHCRQFEGRPTNNKRKDLRSEYEAMKKKAISLRKFDDKAATELHRLHKVDKVPVKTLAEQHKVSVDTVNRAIRRVHAKVPNAQ